ncbi:MAG: hypothetical protein HRT68_14035 [Flavobacteriaceae bacterium]|nr:hypothetical protein [Flavobacteriaceae bacterium]
MNYDPTQIELLSYDALGENFNQRQAIKRQRTNIIRKFSNMDPHVRKKIMLELAHYLE